ncbi:hypothetical protein BOTCAL_0106g00020 [Botryotinia calthae]|uniref:Uncharacterized protein n=1 Tax=Botryotinia calthae TaxID=38488 RepID=A0A4Y8D5L6_9HELO|nr:hypothetical protein BOTCAL_0106g00020 [Botryotinia calthae]
MSIGRKVYCETGEMSSILNAPIPMLNSPSPEAMVVDAHYRVLFTVIRGGTETAVNNNILSLSDKSDRLDRLDCPVP